MSERMPDKVNARNTQEQHISQIECQINCQNMSDDMSERMQET